MKKTLLVFILFTCLSPLFAQELSGTWGGIIYTQLNSYPRNYYLFLEVKQLGRDVWAVYNITDTNNNSITKCLCKLKAVLPKKSSARLEFYKEGVIDYDKAANLRNACELLTQAEMHYFKEDSTEYLTGTWFPGVSRNMTDAGSLLVLQHMSNKTFRNVDDYFASLAMPKSIPDDKPMIIPDKVSAGLLPEKRLIETLKTMVEKSSSINTGRKNPKPDNFY